MKCMHFSLSNRVLPCRERAAGEFECRQGFRRWREARPPARKFVPTAAVAARCEYACPSGGNWMLASPARPRVRIRLDHGF